MSGRSRVLVATILFVFVVALGLAWRYTRPSSIAAAFDSPPPPPGYTWTRDGERVSDRMLVTAAGPAHCDLQAIAFLSIGWPPGTTMVSPGGVRQYVRDTRGVLRADGRRSDLDAVLPTDAARTGFRYENIEIYVSPTEPTTRSISSHRSVPSVGRGWIR